MEIMTRTMARTVQKVRLVGEGVNEIVSTDMALRRADEEGLDLVIVSDKSDPPVVRIQDFKKLEYERKKARSGQKTKTVEVKEIQLRVNISDHDLQTKVSAVRRFLERGDKVKLTVRLKGRERETPERASQLIQKVAESLPCKMSRIPGPITIAILEPSKEGPASGTTANKVAPAARKSPASSNVNPVPAYSTAKPSAGG